MQTQRMYEEAKTWNPFRGCEFNCTYCGPSFKRQAKRQMHRCMKCYSFEPHFHPERLKVLPNNRIIFVCGVGDLSFCEDGHMRQIVERVIKHDKQYGDREYYFQSKRPEYFAPYISSFSKNCILVTTLETNRDEGYGAISEAPPPKERYRQFKELDYPRKVVTVEPVLDFDLDEFSEMLLALEPEYVWIGFNSRPEFISVPEPTNEKVAALIEILEGKGIKVKRKDLREIDDGDDE